MIVSKYRNVLYIIATVIVGVIAIQFYWNYNNYLQNKQQFYNDVRVSLDNAVDKYYTELAEKTTIGFAYNDDTRDSVMQNSMKGLFDKIDINESSRVMRLNYDSIDLMDRDNLKVFTGIRADSLLNSIDNNRHTSLNDSLDLSSDSLGIKSISALTSKIVISIKNDSISLDDIEANFKEELNRKQANLSYGLAYKVNDSIVRKVHPNLVAKSNHTFNAESSFLPKNSQLSIHFRDATSEILVRSAMGILISFLLILSVISILFYLLKIIRDQKQLAEMKNDLISNITHEFKTPIATVGVALESMKDFKVLEDKEKTERYIAMSETQLKKLNLMVEKLLETASLDSDTLSLNLERINLIELIASIVTNYNLHLEGKTLEFNYEDENLFRKVDIFHLENAISNLIDNAIKYGGDQIEVTSKKTGESIVLTVKDSGTGLTKAETLRIFDKFYRVPKGNTHDVKGFGIGLYYTKKIVEKHGGRIKAVTNLDGTTFIITLPNAG